MCKKSEVVLQNPRLAKQSIMMAKLVPYKGMLLEPIWAQCCSIVGGGGGGGGGGGSGVVQTQYRQCRAVFDFFPFNPMVGEGSPIRAFQ